MVTDAHLSLDVTEIVEIVENTENIGENDNVDDVVTACTLVLVYDGVKTIVS